MSKNKFVCNLETGICGEQGDSQFGIITLDEIAKDKEKSLHERFEQKEKQGKKNIKPIAK